MMTATDYWQKIYDHERMWVDNLRAGSLSISDAAGQSIVPDLIEKHERAAHEAQSVLMNLGTIM